MQAKANKLRGQLANVAIERVQFTQQVKDLQAQVNISKTNMDKIIKGLKGRNISYELTELDLDNPHPTTSTNHHGNPNKNNTAGMTV